MSNEIINKKGNYSEVQMVLEDKYEEVQGIEFYQYLFYI